MAVMAPFDNGGCEYLNRKEPEASSYVYRWNEPSSKPTQSRHCSAVSEVMSRPRDDGTASWSDKGVSDCVARGCDCDLATHARSPVSASAV